MQIVERGHVMEKPVIMSEQLWATLNKCLEYEPTGRPEIHMVGQALAAF